MSSASSESSCASFSSPSFLSVASSFSGASSCSFPTSRFSQLAKDIDRVARAVELYHAAPKVQTGLKKLKDDVQDTIKLVEERLQEDPEKTAADLKGRLTPLSRELALRGVKELYQKQFYPVERNRPSTPQEIVEVLRSDMSLFSLLPPIQAVNGTERAVFLVDCPGVESRVFKFTDQVESISNEIWQAFLAGFDSNPKIDSYGLSVPKASRMDIANGVYEEEVCSLESFSKEEISQLKSQLREMLPRLLKSSEDIDTYTRKLDTDTILLQEKIKGQDLQDFFYTKYIKSENGQDSFRLSKEQRMKLFERLGRREMAALAIGVLDSGLKCARLSDESGYEFPEFAEANLGNTMIRYDEESKMVSLYAIDNAIEKELTHMGVENQQYIAFVEEFFSKEKDPFAALGIKIISNIKTALKEGLPGPNVLPVIRKIATTNCEFVFKDLNGDGSEDAISAHTALTTGLREMFGFMQKEILPAWEKGEKMQAFRSSLLKRYPETLETSVCIHLLKALDLRFQSFQSIKIGSL